MTSALPTVANATELIVVRRFLVEGIDAVVRGDDVSVRSGIVLVDLAVETLLKTVLRRYGKSIHPKSDFHKLLAEVVGAPGTGGPDLSYVTTLTPLRNTRNCVMHDGTGQEPHVALALVSSAQSVLVRVVHDVWDRDLVNLGTHEFVNDPAIRQFLDEGTAHFAAGRYGRAAGTAKVVFQSLLWRWTKFTSALFGVELSRRDEKRDEPPLLAVVSAGIYLPHLRRFREATSGLLAYLMASSRIEINAGSWELHRAAEQQVTDARFALDFVSGVALQMDERIGLAGFESAASREMRRRVAEGVLADGEPPNRGEGSTDQG